MENANARFADLQTAMKQAGFRVTEDDNESRLIVFTSDEVYKFTDGLHLIDSFVEHGVGTINEIAALLRTVAR